MNRTKKLSLLSLALLLVCGAAFAAVQLSPQEDTVQDTSFSLLALDPEQLTQLSWTLDGETLTFAYDSQAGWSYPADSAFPLDRTLLDTMADTLSSVTAYRTIQGVDDLSQYGLEQPQLSLTAVTQDGEYHLDLGDETAMGGQRYVSLQDGNVYLADSNLLAAFSYNLYDFVALEEIPSMTQLTAFTVTCSNRDLDLVYLEDSGLAYNDHYVWFQRDGEAYTTLDTELTEAFLENITLLSWQSCVNYQTDEGALADYGLDTPAAVVTVDYVTTTQEDSGQTDADGNVIYTSVETAHTFTLEIGDYTGESCYARLSGSQMVYTVDAAVADAMVYLSLNSLLPDDVILLDYDALEAVDITLDGEHYHMEKTVVETSGEDADTNQETVWTMDGTQVDLQPVLTALTALSASGSQDGVAPERGEEIRFLFHQNHTGFPTVELVFYSYDSSSCLVSLNGETRLFVDREEVVSIVEQVNALVLG